MDLACRMGTRRLVACSLLASALAFPLVVTSCGSGSKASAGAGAGGTSGTGASGTGGSGGGITLGDAGCSTGQACGDGGICAGAVCCAAALACGDVCCSGAEVCSFQKCVTPGAPCSDSSDCMPGEYCESQLGQPNDAGAGDGSCVGAQTGGRCLPSPPTCAADAGTSDAGGVACLEQCSFKPTGTFNPVLEYSWGGVITSPFNTDVMMAPIVLPLEDTNCDGKIDQRDIPSIVFSSFTNGVYNSAGTLHAIRVMNGALADRWATGPILNPRMQIAGGNLDGMPGNEIVACSPPTGNGTVNVMAFSGKDGTMLWSTPVAGGAGFEGQMSGIACFMPSIADLDGSGEVDVIVEGAVLVGATGHVKFTLPGATFVISDIDGNGKLDIVTGTGAFNADGSVLATAPGIAGAWPAIGDLDGTKKPEVVSIDFPTHTLSVWHYDVSSPTKATVVRTGVDINGTAPQHCPGGSEGSYEGGGPPTIADFNGDGYPDVALAGGIAYTILDGKKLMDTTVANAATILWTSVTQDCTSASTGSSVFDFEGTGVAQAVYSDENYLRIYDGPTGNVLWKTCNTTGTEQEYPVIADVDNDGHADIVVVSNAVGAGSVPGSEIYCSDDPSNPNAPHAQSGVRVFGDANGTWVRTRAIWNEHAYHITNVNDDGSIPMNELPNWLQPGFNDFRQNKQSGDVFAAPDLVVTLASTCPGPTALVATVRNIGQAAAPSGVVVGFYEGAPPGTKLGQATTTQILYPAESQAVTFTLSSPDQGLVSGTTPVYAKVDDTTTPHPSWHECNTANDLSPPISAKCAQ